MTEHYDIKWLTDQVERGASLKFLYFWGHMNKHKQEIGNFCLSQWFESPFTVDCVTYKTAEHWMMTQKALLFNDISTYVKIIAADRPGEVKELGRQVIGFDDQTWNSKRCEIVKTGNTHKFNQHAKLADYLLKTGDRILVEASPVDITWEIGLLQDSKDIDNIYAWRGLNLLGFILMEVRDFLKQFRHFKPLDHSVQAPWKKFPNLAKEDLFWKMGQGEDYLRQFDNYYNALTNRDKTIFHLTNPAPCDWSDTNT